MNNNSYTGDTQRLYARPADPEPEAEYMPDDSVKQRNRLAFLGMAFCVLMVIWYSTHPGQSISGTPGEGQRPPITIIDNSSHIRVLCWCPDGDTYGEYRP
jgi:hypothetical protein